MRRDMRKVWGIKDGRFSHLHCAVHCSTQHHAGSGGLAHMPDCTPCPGTVPACKSLNNFVNKSSFMIESLSCLLICSYLILSFQGDDMCKNPFCSPSTKVVNLIFDWIMFYFVKFKSVALPPRVTEYVDHRIVGTLHTTS